jgi:dolichyl-phosphate-mannose--protein O-mannosyl transferase
LVYRLFGADNPLAPRIVQAALGSLSCGMLYLIGRSAFSRTVGAIASLAAATYWIFIYFDGELLIPVLIVFLDLGLLGLLL